MVRTMTRLRKNGFAALGALVFAAAIAAPVLASAHGASGGGPGGHMGMGAGQGMMQGMMGTMPGTPGTMPEKGTPNPEMMQDMRGMHGAMGRGMTGNKPAHDGAGKGAAPNADGASGPGASE